MSGASIALRPSASWALNASSCRRAISIGLGGGLRPRDSLATLPGCPVPAPLRVSPPHTLRLPPLRPALPTPMISSMRPIWLRLHSELRSRWRAWAGLAVIVGVAAGAVIAAAAGARRTDSAYSRFAEAHRAYDAIVVNYPEDGTAVLDFDLVARLPQVADSARGFFEYLDVGPGTPALASADGRIGTDINRFKMLDGRHPRPDRADEVVVSFALADRFGLRVGSTIDIFDLDTLEEGLESLPPEERAQAEAEVAGVLAAIPDAKLRVVGIEASPGEFPPIFTANRILIHGTPALHRLRAGGDTEAIMVRLERGSADLPAFQAALEPMGEGRPIQLFTEADQSRGIRRSIHLQALALWLLAGFAGLAGALVLSQLLARSAYLESGDHSALAALGLTRWQLWALGMARMAVVGAAGAVLAAALAVAVSPLTPTGLARVAEPDPGVRLDSWCVGIGMAATVLVVVVLGAQPSWWHARASGLGREKATRTSRLVGAAAGAGLPAPAVAGIRMALEPGRGANVVPVRSTIAGLTLGIAALTAAVTFAASLDHLLATPRLYGHTWDLRVANFGFGPPLATEGVAVARSVPGVAGISVGFLGVRGRIGSATADVIGLDPVEGRVLPPIIEGSAPLAPDEVALGRRTMREAGARLGQRVELRFAGLDEPLRLRVVGTAVVPAVGDVGTLGEGALLTYEGIRRTDPGDEDDPGEGDLFLQLESGADPGQVADALEEKLGEGTQIIPADKPTDIVNFGGVQNTPLVVGAILGVVAAATLAHTLSTAVRRRRRDLAIFKTVGFTRSQVTAAVAWQATTLAALAVVVGLPVGLAGGRWAWMLAADRQGIVSEPALPLLLLLLAVPAALLLANLIAAVPARVGASMRPATVLRTE
jgi:ABC-type antimicrobial peptide transport system permease subunit